MEERVDRYELVIAVAGEGLIDLDAPAVICCVDPAGHRRDPGADLAGRGAGVVRPPFPSARVVTSEGFEHTFALFYLSRFVLCYEMIDLLAAAPRPMILNVADPGSGTQEVKWGDLGGEHGYSGGWALAQGWASSRGLGHCGS